MSFVIAFIVGLVIGAVAYMVTHVNVTVTIETPLIPSTQINIIEPKFTAYRDGDVCMMQFDDFTEALEWARLGYHFEIYSTVGKLVISR